MANSANFLSTHEVAISTLSPVHIGCGEDYEPTNYVIYQKKLHAFDPARLLTQLTPKERDELSRALDDKNPLLAAQRFFARYREPISEIASHNVPVVDSVNQFYESRFGKVAQREEQGKAVINKLEIARSAFDLYSQLPLLPGSSLKGAIRTAVLEALRQKNAPRTRFNQAKDMEKELLGGSFHTDPLRLLKVSDAHFVPGTYTVKNAAGESQQRARDPRRICFQVNRKKRPNQFATTGNVNTLIECVPAAQPRAFTGSLSFEDKARRGANTPAAGLDFAQVAKACNDFYVARFNAEAEVLADNNYVSDTWLKNAKTRLSPTGIWGKLIAENKGFLLRVGRHSGAESVTINAPRSIKILRGKGSPPDYKPEATTLWLASDDKDAQEKMQPFGWVFVQLK